MFGIRVDCLPSRYGRIYAPTDDRVIGRSLRLYGEWAEHEISVLSSLLVDGPTIVDVGANIGTHSLAFAARFPKSTVMAFEPQAAPHAMLCASAMLNGYGNIRPHNLGCAERMRVLEITPDYEAVDWNIGAINLDKAVAEDGTPVVLMPLDRILGQHEVQLIKIDVEGNEASVIAGAVETLRRCKPAVFFEVLDISSLAASRQILEAMGYVLFWLETSAFNIHNFAGADENIWSRCELGVLALPLNLAQNVNLHRITGSETELPAIRDPSVGFDNSEPLIYSRRPGSRARGEL